MRTIHQYLAACITDSVDEDLLLMHFTKKDVTFAENVGYITRYAELSDVPEDAGDTCTHRINRSMVNEQERAILNARRIIRNELRSVPTSALLEALSREIEDMFPNPSEEELALVKTLREAADACAEAND